MGIPLPIPAHQSPSAWPPAQPSAFHPGLYLFEAAAVTRAALTEVGGTQSRDDETSKVRVEPTTSFPCPGLAGLPRTPPPQSSI